MRSRVGSQRGFTLMELVVAMAVLAIGYAVVAATILTTQPRDQGDERRDMLRRARTQAIEGGVVVVAGPDSALLEEPVLFLPDGRHVGLESERDDQGGSLE